MRELLSCQFKANLVTRLRRF
ncbi:MAG: hypothetical protein ACLVLH_27670 [Eisenbergiella massiliensis]